MTAFQRLLFLLLFTASIPSYASVSVEEEKKELEPPEITYAEHMILMSSFTLERLHRLKINKHESVEQSMEVSLASDAKSLFNILEHGKPTPADRKSIYGILRLLSVMNEKIKIDLWRSDELLQDIFKTAQDNDPEHTKKLRCYDWTQPMWKNTKGCN